MKKTILIILMLIIAAPLLIGMCLRYINLPFISGSGDAWLGYWSNFLGSALGVLGAFLIMQSELKVQKKNEKVAESIITYNKFILKYYYCLLIICKYENDGYGGDKKLSIPDIQHLKQQLLIKMLDDRKYMDGDLLQNVTEWNLYHKFLDDLLGYKDKYLEASVMVNFSKFMELNYQINKNENLFNFIIEFKPHALLYLLEILIFNYCLFGSSESRNIKLEDIHIAKMNLSTKINLDLPQDNEEKFLHFKKIEDSLIKDTDGNKINKFIISLFHNVPS